MSYSYDEIYRKKQIDIEFTRKLKIIRKIFFIACICLFFYFRSKPAKAESSPAAMKTDERVCTVLKATHRMVRDTNWYDKINCVDYAVTFKFEWDKRYNEDECEIVRNKNDSKHWHHLFVRVKSNGYWIYVEPQGTSDNYNITSYWENNYDSRYNVYGETELWLTKGYL